MVPRNPTCKFSTQEKAHGGHPPRGKMVDGVHGGENKDNQHSYFKPLGTKIQPSNQKIFNRKTKVWPTGGGAVVPLVSRFDTGEFQLSTLILDCHASLHASLSKL